MQPLCSGFPDLPKLVVGQSCAWTYTEFVVLLSPGESSWDNHTAGFVETCFSYHIYGHRVDIMDDVNSRK